MLPRPFAQMLKPKSKHWALATKAPPIPGTTSSQAVLVPMSLSSRSDPRDLADEQSHSRHAPLMHGSTTAPAGLEREKNLLRARRPREPSHSRPVPLTHGWTTALAGLDLEASNSHCVFVQLLALKYQRSSCPAQFSFSTQNFLPSKAQNSGKARSRRVSQAMRSWIVWTLGYQTSSAN